MITKFPEFKKLELEDKEDFEANTKQFEPYSDFNFVSLWSYNTERDAQVCLLNENIVIRFRDYLTNEPFYSFLGTGKAEETVNLLTSFSKDQGLNSALKLIPQVSVDGINLPGFSIEEDRNNFDYILSIEEVALLTGGRYHTHKNFVNKFNNSYPDYHLQELNLLDPNVQSGIIQVFYKWETKRAKKREETQHELSALERFLRDSNEFDLIALGVYDKEILVGFMTASLEQMDYAVGHFTKADPDYSGVYYFIYHNMAKILLEKGYKYFNNEQDLGIEGLRKSKEQWNPVKFLKKYTIKSP